MPLLLALMSSVLWGAADFAGGTAARRLPPVLVVAISQLIAGIAVLAVAIAWGELDAPLDYLPWAVGAGLVGAVALIAFYAALAAGTMGVVAPIAALGAVVPVAGGLISGERPSVWQLVGIAVAVAGVVLASGPELSGATGVRPLLLAGVAAVGFGLALSFLAEGSDTSLLMTAVAMRATSVPIMFVLLVTVLRPRGGGLSPRDMVILSFIGIGDVGANLAFGQASTGELVSVVAVLGSLYPVVTVLLARVIHHERLARVQNVGVVFALAGVVLIAAG